MNNKVVFEVTARPEVALKKLVKAQIPVGNVKTQGAKVCFSVNREYIKKVFAIFNHPCYNTVIRRKSAKMLFAHFCKRRFGLIAGAAAFVVLCALPQTVVLKIEVTGNAPHLSQQVISIATECGARQFTPCTLLDKPLLRSRVTALDGVEFCSVTRQGWALIIDVHAHSQSIVPADYSPLKAEKQGKLIKLVCICGTPEKSEGDDVKVGNVLIGAYEVAADGTKHKCLAAGFAEIEVKGSLSLFFTEETLQNEKYALSAPSLYSEKVLSKSLKITPCDGGFYYEVSFTYLHTQPWNID